MLDYTTCGLSLMGLFGAIQVGGFVLGGAHSVLATISATCCLDTFIFIVRIYLGNHFGFMIAFMIHGFA